MAAGATAAAKKAASKKEQMKRSRAAIECVAPSGYEVTIRPPNLEMHVLAGGLPVRLKELAAQGVVGIDNAIKEATTADPELQGYLCSIVCQMLLDPVFDPPRYALMNDKGEEVPMEHADGTERVACVEGDDLDEFLLPIDFKWLLLVAFGNIDEDGEGKPLWGRPLLARFEPFRSEHGCASDCPKCARVEASLSLR